MDIPSAKLFSRGDRLYVQAQQIWLILVSYVMFGPRDEGKRIKTMTYGDLAQRMGYDSAQAGHTLGRQLGIVGNYCKRNDLPPLNTIVVAQETGQPGDEVVVRDGMTVDKEQRAVCKFNWFEIRVPTTGTFRQVWEST